MKGMSHFSLIPCNNQSFSSSSSSSIPCYRIMHSSIPKQQLDRLQQKQKDQWIQQLNYLHQRRTPIPVELIGNLIPGRFKTEKERNEEERKKKERTEKKRKAKLERKQWRLNVVREVGMLKRTEELGSGIVEIEAVEQPNPLTSTVRVCHTMLVNVRHHDLSGNDD